MQEYAAIIALLFCLRREGDFFALGLIRVERIFLFGFWIPYLILTVQKIIPFLTTSAYVQS